MKINFDPYYVATDRRCYNGAPCSDLQREWDTIDKLTDLVKKNGGHITYFPVEGKFTGHNIKTYESTEFCDSKASAAISYLKMVDILD